MRRHTHVLSDGAMSCSSSDTARQHRRMALVTGASSGIGRAIAVELASRKFDLVLTARREARLQTLGAELARLYGVGTTVVAIDLAAPQAATELHDRVCEMDPSIDVLVNSAGVGNHGDFASTDWLVEHRMIQLNIVALTELTKLVLAGMLGRRAGRILNVASTAAFKPGPFYAVYAATKAYVLSFSEALQQELSGTGVTATALCPGSTSTSFASAAGIQRKRLLRLLPTMRPDVVARCAVKGLLAGRPLVIPGYTNNAVAVALKLLPRSTVRALARHARR